VRGSNQPPDSSKQSDFPSERIDTLGARVLEQSDPLGAFRVLHANFYPTFADRQKHERLEKALLLSMPGADMAAG
jgi:hypothetical protein